MNDKILNDIVNKYGTPVYAYDTEKIMSQYALLKNSLPQEIGIFYSMKANPLLGICQLFKKLGSGIETASSGELHTALCAGFPPEKIIFTSPGKTYDELKYAVETGIYSINIESLEEAEVINEIADKKGRVVDISIRINPDFDIAGSGIKMSGVASQFGIDQIRLDSVLNELKALQNLNIMGIHIYTGTQALNAHSIVQSMEQIVKLALDTSEKYVFKLKFLNLGGGFGVPYFKDDSTLDMDILRNEFSEMWNKYKDRLFNTQVFVESGRFLMAESGTYLTKILYRKECKGRKYLVCDGGSNQHAASAFLGRHIRNNFPIQILNKSSNEEQVNVVGPLCTPTDVIGQNVMLPEAVPGDIVAVLKSGAYGVTQSPGLFLSHPLPAEVQYYEGKTYILRERWGKEDFMLRQKPMDKNLL
ncbi:type III PLP-dependent enzyme [Ruminiclostridium cellulolyticum]|uniref:Orn/DAP/Arg decarboxylase 2 n=1 Tax=Ruminiclostridium cellulolyticum (strain ATCC 35319 / DSM 5812 / JCM 6584 / H10) TaxID=394503 RepID=B8I674_RUMCH|nr:type III PLP-dependent enzyme [Ruminiclostridium cellulolyticum]ACL76839.1 Orn/DAP/Arg decarboxylase 2 [Ruminiclostridium cellulolyticum H10]